MEEPGTPATVEHAVSSSSTTRRSLASHSLSEFRLLAAEENRGWRWEGILQASGIVLLVGQPYVGKTTLIAALIAAMSGTHELAGRAVKGGRMLLVSLEHTKHDLLSALDAAANGAGIAESDLGVDIVRGPLDLDSPDEVDALDRLAKKCRARVIVIDPFRRSTRTDENRAEDVSLYFQSLQKLTRNGKRLVIVIHHLTKNGDQPRGSMDFVAAADGWIRLTRPKKDIIKLEATHHGAAPVSINLAVHRTDHSLKLEVAASSSGSTTDKLKDEVLRAIETTPRMGRRKIREALRSTHASNDAIDAAVDELAKEGRIVNSGSAGKHAWEVCT